MGSEDRQQVSSAAPKAAASLLFSPWISLLWLALLLTAALWSAFSLQRGYNFDSSVLALLPNDSGLESGADPALIARADEQLAALASQRMVFLVSHEDAAQSTAAAAQLAAQLEASGLFATVQSRIAASEAARWQQAFFPYRYGLISTEAYQSLSSIPPGPEHPLLNRALARLYSPMASAVAPQLVDDPLQLFFDWQLQVAPRSGFSLDNNWLSRSENGRHYRLLSAELNGDPFALDYQQSVMNLLASARASIPGDAQLLVSGLLRHTAHGAAQARQEISTIGLGSMLGIALLLLYCFRRVSALALALLPIACGWLFAAALCMALFERLHLITLAFGASLIGVAVDYSLHYLCAREEVADTASQSRGRDALRSILPGLSLGLLSSALAYAAQGAAPFPGLRQMAVFSVSGLLGAWLTVVLFLPRLTAGGARTPSPTLNRLAAGFDSLLRNWPRASSPRVALVLIAAALLALVQLTRLEFDDDLRRLQTSPAEMLAEDAQVQALTGSINPGQYLLLSADSEEQLLRAEENLRPDLQAMVQRGDLADYQAISRWVPSLARQRENIDLNAKRVFADDGLAPLLAKQIGAAELSASMVGHFAQDRENRLTIEDWLSSAAGEAQDFLWLGEFQGRVHSLILLAGIADLSVLADLQALAAGQSDTWWVDKVASISRVLESHRRQLLIWIAIAYAAVASMLSLRYGRRALRIIAPPAFASLATLAILSAGGWTITIFNLLALLLVLGIGLDAGIFLRESARSRYTWAAVSLAVCTTLLAFGLLSLSATPVLQQFGITVLLGIVFVWLLAPCFAAYAKNE